MPFSSRETNISQEERGELAMGKNEAIPFLSTAIRWSRRNTHIDNACHFLHQPSFAFFFFEAVSLHMLK